MKGKTTNVNAVTIDIIIEIIIVVLPGVVLSGIINPERKMQIIERLHTLITILTC